MLIIICLNGSDFVQAHIADTPQLTNVEAGPYRIFAWTQPEPWVVGDAHISVAVTLAPPDDASTSDRQRAEQLDEPVTDAIVRLILTPQKSPADRFIVLAQRQSQLNEVYYEADVRLSSEDSWDIQIEVEGPTGEGRTEFNMIVLAGTTGNRYLISLTGLIVLILLGSMWAWWRMQGGMIISPQQAAARRRKMSPRSLEKKTLHGDQKNI